MFTSVESPITSDALAERRFYPRIAPSSLIGVAFGDSNLGMLLNLSENGLLVSTPLALVQNFVCRVSLLLEGLAKPIEVYARVVWTSESHRSGIQLLDLCDHDREQLRKWAALAAERGSATDPVKPRDAQSSAVTPVRGKSAPQSGSAAPISRIFFVACATAAVLMLITALVLRGTPFRALLSHSSKSEIGATLAMQPGGVVANEPPNPQAFAMPSATPSGPLTSLANPAGAAPSAAAANPIPFLATRAQPRLASGTTIAPNKGTPPALAPDLSSPALSTKRAVDAPHVMAKTKKKQSARNSAVLQAQKHFGDQFIGHLDLASSNENASTGQTLPDTIGAAAQAPSSVVEEKHDDSVPPSTSPRVRLDSRPSAITGSITADSAATLASPRPSGSAVPVGLPDPPSVGAANSSDRALQITLPASARALYINLPGEQIVQSPAITLHIQRAVLAPASSATSVPRTETVVLGDLLSHVDPHTPRLTSETGTRVGVRAFLTSDGRVAKLRPVNGSVALVSSAARAIREWRFQPTLLAGEPVPMAIYVLVEFHPEANGPANP